MRRGMPVNCTLALAISDWSEGVARQITKCLDSKFGKWRSSEEQRTIRAGVRRHGSAAVFQKLTSGAIGLGGAGTKRSSKRSIVFASSGFNLAHIKLNGGIKLPARSGLLPQAPGFLSGLIMGRSRGRFVAQRSE
jgi:hypothetical protein